MQNLPPNQPTEHFVSMLLKHQVQLRGFILASLGHHANGDDVLQRTNLTLWRKASEFRQDAEFMPWAITVARFEILAFLRDSGRERLIFDPDVMELVAGSAEAKLGLMPQRMEALRACLAKLSDENRNLLDQRYAKALSMAQIADTTGRSIDSIKSLMSRIRRQLGNCINRQMREQGT